MFAFETRNGINEIIKSQKYKFMFFTKTHFCYFQNTGKEHRFLEANHIILGSLKISSRNI